jgi:hypothetical protein
MTVEQLIDRHARDAARGRAARLGARIALLGAVGVAVALLLERLGVDLPVFGLPPAVAGTPGFLNRVVGYVAISIAGFFQVVLLLAIVFAAAWLVRSVAAPVLRRGTRATARALDRALGTDRFSAALEARGALTEAVRAHALAHAPERSPLRPKDPGRGQRLLTTAAVLLAVLVALSPGVAGGEPGHAPVPGETGGTKEETVRLRLYGPARSYAPGESIFVQVVAEALAPPERDLDAAVYIAIDGGVPQRTARRLFLAGGATGEDAATLDLKRFVKDLKPGTHKAVAYAGGAVSNEYIFKIESPDGGGGGGAQEPKQDPQKGKGEGRPQGGARPQVDPKYVKPLVADGEKVKKKARVPIEVPGGAPTDKPLDEAWPELKKRQEAALKRPGLSPHARQLVKEYFEKLRPEDK